MSNPLCFKFTYKQFPENSTSWLDSSPDHTQRIVITRDAYFDKDMTSSAHVFNSKPSAGVIPFNSHLDPNGLQPSDNSQPSIVRQTGSAVNLGNLPSIFIEEPKDSEQPLQEENNGSASSLPDTDNDPHNSDDKTDPITDNDIYLGPSPPTPQTINLTNHQKRHTSLQKEMTIYFQECSEPPPSVDPIHTAMLTIDTTASSSTHSSIDDSEDKYLPELQSFKAVLKLNDDIKFTWLHAINMEFKTLNDHNTFVLGQEPCKNKLIIPIKQVLKIKQTETGTRLEKLKARLVAHGDMKRKINKARAAFQKQKQKQQQRQENAKNNPARTSKKTNTLPIEIPQPFENTWSSCATSRGVKLLLLCIISLSTKCSMLAAMTLPNKNSKPLSVIISMLHILDLHNGSCKCIAIDQHCYVLNTLQRYNPKLKFPERETPFPPDFTFSKDNRPVTDHDKRIIDKQHKHQPFRSTACMLLYLAYNTQANINSAFCKLAKACIYPRNFNFCALTIWLLGFLQQRPAYNAAKFYADTNSNPVYHICHQHCIPHTNFTILLMPAGKIAQTLAILPSDV